jgi:hypothetical protein
MVAVGDRARMRMALVASSWGRDGKQEVLGGRLAGLSVAWARMEAIEAPVRRDLRSSTLDAAYSDDWLEP